jgi:hypothetical protein
MDRRQELEEELQILKAALESMDERVAALEDPESPAPSEERVSTRRGFLRLGAAAAMGAVGLAAGRALPAAAADGDPVLAGHTTNAESPTILTADGGTPPAQVLAAEQASFDSAGQANSGVFAGAVQGLAGNGAVEGVDGWAQGDSSFGVYGLTDSGFGVVGESNTGIGLYARRSGRIQQDPLTDTPQNTIPTPGDFETVRDANGAMWISGPGGSWMRPSLNSFPDPRRIWDGWYEPTAAGTYGPIDATQQVTTSGFTGGASGVPAGAQAVYCAVQSYSVGYLTLYPDGTARPGVVNWSGTVSGKLNMIFMLVPLSAAGKFLFYKNFSGRVFVDAWGFLI